MVTCTRKKVVGSPPTIKINFQITIDYGEPELKALVDMIGDNVNNYMTPMPFPILDSFFLTLDCQFYDKHGGHLDGDKLYSIKVRGCVWGWSGEPQSVILYGTFQIGTFCQNGNGHLKVRVTNGPLDGVKLECEFPTVKVEPKPKK
jgi:hypothetical protein